MNNLRAFRFLLVSLILLIAVCMKARAELKLADGGKSSYRIVIATNAIPSERHAAEELQQYFQKLAGATLPIVTDDKKSADREILLGDNAHLRKLGAKIDFTKLGPDGFTLLTDKQTLIIAGNHPRGTLNGVYSLLEDKLGVRWLTPELEIVPKTNHLALPALDETQVPALENREVFWTEALRDGDFAARHRLNGSSHKLEENHGGRFAAYFPFVHSMDSLIPQELFKEHPEYFPFINGKRVNGYVQRCLSNPDVLKLAKARVREWIKEHPEANIISVSQNDAGDWCQCDQCRALDEAEGSPSASLLRFVNAIAEDIEADYPNIRIDTLAYQYTRKPPKTIRPRKNVIVRLCSIECCFAHPLDTCTSERNHGFRDDIIAWHAVAPTLYVWDYTTDFAHYQQPFPNFNALQANVQFYARHGVKSLFEQGNSSKGGFGELGPLRAYVLAELLWNPETNVKKHISNFIQGYYGAAAPQLSAYLDLLEAQVYNPEIHAYLYDPPSAPYLNPTFLDDADKLLAQAENAAENQIIRQRVQVARLPVWFVTLSIKRGAPEDRKVLLTHFLEIARQTGITEISEGRPLEEWAKFMETY